MTNTHLLNTQCMQNTTLRAVLLTHSIPRTTLKYYHYLLYER